MKRKQSQVTPLVASMRTNKAQIKVPEQSLCTNRRHLAGLEIYLCRSQQPCGRSPAEIVGSNPTGGMDVFSCECCMLSGRCFCDKLTSRPEESYRLWCVVECDIETSRMRRPWPALGRSATDGGVGRIISILILNFDAREEWVPISHFLKNASLTVPSERIIFTFRIKPEDSHCPPHI